jgi:hypothetical protein
MINLRSWGRKHAIAYMHAMCMLDDGAFFLNRRWRSSMISLCYTHSLCQICRDMHVVYVPARTRAFNHFRRSSSGPGRELLFSVDRAQLERKLTGAGGENKDGGLVAISTYNWPGGMEARHALSSAPPRAGRSVESSARVNLLAGFSFIHLPSASGL